MNSKSSYLEPVDDVGNQNGMEVVDMDGDNPTRCGTVLKEIALLQPVNSARGEYILKRILIEKDTGKPATGPCVDALQDTLDKEDALKPSFIMKRRSMGGVDPQRQPLPELPVEPEQPVNPIVYSPPVNHHHNPHHQHQLPPVDDVDRNMTFVDYDSQFTDGELQQLSAPRRPWGLEAPSVQQLNGPAYRNGRRNKCSYNRPVQPVLNPEIRPNRRVCRRRDLPPAPPAPLPFCNTEKPWLNTAPCINPPTTQATYSEVVQLPVEIAPPPPLVYPRSAPRKCKNSKVSPLPIGRRCKSRGSQHRLQPLPPSQDFSGPRYEVNGNGQDSSLDLQQPYEFSYEDRKKREPIPALPVYRL
ncbi:unnamed protein product, partial [Mesorhabditis spiculigera]